VSVPRPFTEIVVDLVKLRDYCLSDTHPRGRHKARVFRAKLGLTSSDAELLRQVLLNTASDKGELLQATQADPFGQRYLMDFELTTPAGTATIRSGWIVLSGENVLRLLTCYVL
jgi:hypothetical protein